MAVSLRRFEIRDAAVSFDNRQAGLTASLKGFHQSLKGDLSRDLVTIETRARSDEVSLTFAGIPYLNRVKLDVTADVRADLAGKAFTLSERRDPAQRPAAPPLGLGQARPATTSASTSRSRRPAPTSGTSCRWCRRSTPMTSSR